MSIRRTSCAEITRQHAALFSCAQRYFHPVAPSRYGTDGEKIEHVYDGIDVVDAAGEKVGEVELIDTDRHVRSDLIATVADDTVTLTVTKARLPKEE